MPVYQITHLTRLSTGTAPRHGNHSILNRDTNLRNTGDSFELGSVSPSWRSRLGASTISAITAHPCAARTAQGADNNQRSVVRRDEPILRCRVSHSLRNANLIDLAVIEEDFTPSNSATHRALFPLVPEAGALADEFDSPESFQYFAWLGTLVKFNDFIYHDAEATEISTPLLGRSQASSGVCQDFAHLLGGCLRQLDYRYT